MIDRLGKMLIATIDLIEAEADMLRARAMTASRDAAVVVVLVLGMAFATLAVATGVVWFLALAIGVPGALVASGSVVFLTLFLLLYRMTHSAKVAMRGEPVQTNAEEAQQAPRTSPAHHDERATDDSRTEMDQRRTQIPSRIREGAIA